MMCSMSVVCPLCCQTSFSSIDALRSNLVQLASGPLTCPICHEIFLGLDKLTIHLFSHTNINSNQNNKINSPSNYNNEKSEAKKDVVQLNETLTAKMNNHNVKSPNAPTKMNFDNPHQRTQEEYLPQSPPPPPPPTATATAAPTTLRTTTAAVKKSKVSKTEAKKQSNKKPQVALLNESESNNSPTSPNQPTSATMAVVVNSMSNLSTCDICEFTFRNKELRDMHVRLVHQNFNYASGLETSSNHHSLENNELATITSPEPDFKCHLCSKTFKMKGSLRVHLKVVHLMGLPYVNNSPKLSICDRIRHKESKQLKTSNAEPASTGAQHQPASSNLYNLQPIALVPSSLNSPSTLPKLSVVNISQPREFLSNTMDNSVNPQLNSNVLLVFNNNNQSISQNISNLNTSNISDKDVVKKLQPNVSNPSTSVPVVVSNNTLDNPKIWECDVCSKAFTTKYFLKKHKRLHTGEMPYTCEICARTFTFQQSYYKHLLYHSDEKPHVCTTCGRAFKELSTLHNHERIHSGEKPFKCDVCGKSFRQRVSFLVHTRIHTGVMPYKCEICQKSFRYKVSQRTHKCQPMSSEESPSHNDTIEHMSENFIKSFLENSTHSSAQIEQLPAQNSPASNEIAAINEKVATPLPSSGSPPSTLNEHQALLSKTIDDIVVESCNKLGIGNDSNECFAAIENVNDGSMSPSQKLQNMRLYSPQLAAPDLNGIEGDLTRFFLETSGGGHNIL